MRRLLIRPGAIGDVILSLPALEAARAEYTEVWTPRVMLPLIRFADRTRAIPDTGLDLVGVVDHARSRAVMRAMDELAGFDSIYSWYGTNRPEFREAVADLPFEFFPALPPPAQGVPKIDAPLDPAAPERLVVLHPFASSPSKRWPLEKFRQVAAAIADDGWDVRWCAGPLREFDRETLPSELEADAVRKADLYDLACWLSAARLYIGNDSGIAHLAAAVGIPVIAIFLRSDPVIWAPRGPRVRVLVRPDVNDVVDAVKMLFPQDAGGFLQ